MTEIVKGRMGGKPEEGWEGNWQFCSNDLPRVKPLDCQLLPIALTRMTDPALGQHPKSLALGACSSIYSFDTSVITQFADCLIISLFLSLVFYRKFETSLVFVITL